MRDTGGEWATGPPPRTPAAAGAGEGSRTSRAAGYGAVATTVVALGLGVPVLVAGAGDDHLRYPEVALVLRACWIGLYAVIGLALARGAGQRRLGLTMTSCAALTAIASTDVLPGAAAYTVSHTAALALPPVLALMLISVPEAQAARRRAQGALLASIPVVLALGTAYLMVAAEAPWGQAASECAGTCAGSAIQVTDAPGLAHALAAAVAIALLAPLAVAGVAIVRACRAAGPITRRALRWVGWLMTVWAAPLAVGLVAMAIDPEPGGLGPYLVTTSVIRGVLPLAILAIVVGRLAKTGMIREELTTRLAHTDDPAQVERVIADVLGDPSLRLAFRDGAEWIDVEGHPIDAEAAADREWVPLDDPQGATLVVDPAMQAQPERMHVIAGLGAAALDRARTGAELRAMRRRLVQVAEDERHRIERNLHDGAQQRLIGMAIRIDMARETLTSHPELALAILRDFGDDVQGALDELRELAHGLHPAVLTDHGLPEALRAMARHAPVDVEMDVAPVGRLDPLAESAVYFCCAEALQNAVKHGGPGARVAVRLSRDDDDAVVFEVVDDGPGFAVPPLRPGTGLMGMRDRVEGVDGTLTIESEPGGGTRVAGRIPAALRRADDLVGA